MGNGALFLSLISFFHLQQLWADEGVILSPIVVHGKEHKALSPLVGHSIFKAEKVSPEKLKGATRQSIADVLRDQVGVDSQSYCANCGAKRLTINGLKGEHTSILVDGLPLYTATANFYGVDSVPLVGLSEVQVMRGSGASLANPDAIGGTINLQTLDPLIKKKLISSSLSINDQAAGTASHHSLLWSQPLEGGRSGLVLGAQATTSEMWDADRNEVSESPERDSQSLMFKWRWIPTDQTDLTVRLGYSNLEILGGPIGAVRPTQVRPVPAQESDFEGGKVSGRYIGDRSRITDWVRFNRLESALHLSHFRSETLTFFAQMGWARQAQDSIYQHGFDYAHVDHLGVVDFGLQWTPSSPWIVRAGLFGKTQSLRSASATLFDQYPPTDSRDIKKDSFDHQSVASYIQGTWFASSDWELDLALRLDHLKVNWLELDNRIDQWVLAPRLQALNSLTEHLTQRLSYGLGYRTPLTYFESQHGNNENGYEVDITGIEKAHSMVYSLSFNTPDYYVTGGLHRTMLEGMAYGHVTQGQPILYRNSSETFIVDVADLLLGYKMTENWMLEGSIEYFFYPDAYKRLLPTAAIERRWQIQSKYENANGWSHFLAVNMVGPRDLSRYAAYNNYYVDRRQFPPPEQPGVELKRQKAPWFMTVDTTLSKKWRSGLTASVGILNIFDYTQAGQGDNPSSWHWHFDHAHFDGLHTWGPLRGREFFAQVEWAF